MLVWGVHILVLRGVREAAALNTIATVAKMVPIGIFIAVVIAGFKANVYSRYAKDRNDVGVATVLGFLGVLCLLVLVTVFSYGILLREDLAALANPSMAGVLARENRNGVPSAALWLTNVVIQLFVLVTWFAESAFTIAAKMTSTMTLVPYLLVAPSVSSWRGLARPTRPMGANARSTGCAAPLPRSTQPGCCTPVARSSCCCRRCCTRPAPGFTSTRGANSSSACSQLPKRRFSASSRSRQSWRWPRSFPARSSS